MARRFLKLVLFTILVGLSGIQAALSQVSSTLSLREPRLEDSAYYDASFFPIGVWLQDPELAGEYKKAGFNTYVGLWGGPTEEQLTTLRHYGMKVFCEQNAIGLRHLKDTIILGWMHGDEPDNAQSLGEGKGYGPPVPPETILREYRQMKTSDPSRPVLLNLGQGVAWDEWYGRGIRTNHPEDYPEYMKGGDIVSFDIYPVAHSNPAISGKLWYVAKGVKRLVQWGRGEKIIWNCLECTHIGEPDKKATPEEIRAEAWMAIIHGSRGLIYFVHQFKPVFNAHALLDDPITLKAVTGLNKEITRLAPIINSGEVLAPLTVQSPVPVATLVRKYKDTAYLFTVNMRDTSTVASFIFSQPGQYSRVHVINENHTIVPGRKSFHDRFRPWEVHLYRLTEQ